MGETPLQGWVDEMATSDAEDMEALATAFDYLLDNVEAFEDGTISYEDLPELSDDLSWVLFEAVRFGTFFYKTTVDAVYVVEGEDSSFVAVYGQEQNAAQRAAEASKYRVAPHPIEGAEELVESYFEGTPDSMVADLVLSAFQAWESYYDDVEGFIESGLLGDDMQLMVAYGILFGMSWERSHASLYGSFTADGVQSIHAAERQAAEAAPADGYTQRIALADGQAAVEAMLDF